MHRLYLKIYLAVLASLVLFVLLVGLTLKLIKWGEPAATNHEIESVVTELAGEVLPVDISEARLQTLLNRWHARFNADLAVYSGDGALLGRAGQQLLDAPTEAMKAESREGDIWVRGGRLGPQMMVALPGDRFLLAIDGTGSRGWRSGTKGILFIVGLLSLVGVAVAIAAWPLSRRLTRRVEKLQASVEQFGQGNLSSRSEVRGCDEVAQLASSFNDSADHIEKLVAGQRTLLANASHELRSPLARIRMAAELMTGAARKQRGHDEDDPTAVELLRNVAELDDLVDEILLASRLDVAAATRVDRSTWAPLDLGGILAEEAVRAGLTPRVVSVPFVGDARLLRRLVRNLVENALRYGVQGDAAQDISVDISTNNNEVTLTVCDRGPGIPDDERTKIFDAFYRVRGASERSGGVGLGLSLVRQIAAHHNGQVRCVPRNGSGACFVVTLPVSASRGARDTPD